MGEVEVVLAGSKFPPASVVRKFSHGSGWQQARMSTVGTRGYKVYEQLVIYILERV